MSANLRSSIVRSSLAIGAATVWMLMIWLIGFETNIDFFVAYVTAVIVIYTVDILIGIREKEGS